MNTNIYIRMTITLKKILQIKTHLENQGKKLRPNSILIKEYKASLKGLNQIQFQSCIGLILGDVRLEINKKGNAGLLKFEWSYKSKEYVFHVYNLFKDYCFTKPYVCTRTNINGKEVKTWRFQTITHKDFLPLCDLFLTNNKKAIKQGLIMNHLSPRGLAYWFIDDGGILGSHRRGIQFHTQGFNKSEVEIICQELKEKFNFDCWVYLHKGKPLINISSKNYFEFVKITEQYIVPRMKNKLRLR